jgi:hypothetical protein
VANENSGDYFVHSIRAKEKKKSNFPLAAVAQANQGAIKADDDSIKGRKEG